MNEGDLHDSVRLDFLHKALKMLDNFCWPEVWLGGRDLAPQLVYAVRTVVVLQ